MYLLLKLQSESLSQSSISRSCCTPNPQAMTQLPLQRKGEAIPSHDRNSPIKSIIYQDFCLTCKHCNAKFTTMSNRAGLSESHIHGPKVEFGVSHSKTPQNTTPQLTKSAGLSQQHHSVVCIYDHKNCPECTSDFLRHRNSEHAFVAPFSSRWQRSWARALGPNVPPMAYLQKHANREYAACESQGRCV